MIPQSHSISKRSRWFFFEKAKQATLLSFPLNMQRCYWGASLKLKHKHLFPLAVLDHMIKSAITTVAWHSVW